MSEIHNSLMLQEITEQRVEAHPHLEYHHTDIYITETRVGVNNGAGAITTSSKSSLTIINWHIRSV